MATTRRDAPSMPADAIPSSSPAFGTPAHPIHPRRTAPIRAPPALQPKGPTVLPVLPVLLPPATLRPLAFRTFTKKHNLTLTSSALTSLAGFIGRHCGAGWREEGLAEKVLDEAAKSWKKSGGPVIVDGDKELFVGILRALEGAMEGGRVIAGSSSLGRQSSFHSHPSEQSALPSRPAPDTTTSFGVSRLEVADNNNNDDEEEEQRKDPREWLRVIGAFDQPKHVYNAVQRHFDLSAAKPSLLPDPARKTELFRQRYHLVHQRVLRNDTFQTPTTQRSASASASTNAITPVANLLGRSGTAHLLLGMLVVSPTGALSLADLTGTIALDMQHARPVPDTGAFFAPGMIVLVDGSYEEDAGVASNLGGTGGIGGTIGGRFLAFSLGHPPCERRTATLGSVDDRDKTLHGPAFGWTDFLGVGSQRATGSRMARIANNLLTPTAPHKIAIAADLHLDLPSTLSALRTLLRTYSPSPTDPNPVYPLAIVLMGNFSSKATLAGVPHAGSIEYKEHFDALASVLAEFQPLVAHTTLVFVPGDNDAWPSAFSAGAATPLPRKPVPALFTNRIRRAVAEANRAIWGAGKPKGKEGDVIWTSNPTRLTWFGVKSEMVILRDDLASRLHRTALRFPKPNADADADADTEMLPPDTLDPDTLTARALTRTILSQAHLSPFPLATRPLHWDYAHALGLYPLPTSLVLADADAPPYVVRYCGCTVVNPGVLDASRGRKGGEGRASWIELDARGDAGVVRCEG